MNTPVHPARRAERSGDWVFIATVVAGYISMFASSPAPGYPPFTTVVLIVLGVLYAVIGTVVAARVGRGRPAVVYFAVQLTLATTIMYLGRGAGFGPIIVLPLAGQSVLFDLPRPAIVGMALLATLTLALPAVLVEGWRSALLASMTLLPGIAFAILYTRMLVAAQNARLEVERLAAELAAANRKLGAYAVQAEELATTKERNRLAREIHDSLGHYLTVINVQLEAARAVLDRDRMGARTALDRAQSLTRDGLAEVRRSVATLRATPTDSRPLPEAVAALVAESRAAGIAIELVVLGTPRPLTPQAELTLFRAAQEGLTNMCKYAHASRADLTLDYRGETTVRLVVQDNGVGTTSTNGGFGLIGVRERTHLLGGDVRIRTAAGQGFTLAVEVPG